MMSSGPSAIWEVRHLVQEPAEARLRELGYQFVPPDVLDRERDNPAEPVLLARLAAALRRLNPWIDDHAVHRAIRAVTQVAVGGLVEANQCVHEALVHNLWLAPEPSDGARKHTVRLIDFVHPEANEFLFTKQYRVAVSGKTIVLDLVVFVNGLPLVVIACTSPTRDADLGAAQQKLVSHQDAEPTEDAHGGGAARLFHAVQILIAMNGQAARYGTVGTTKLWSEWKVCHPLTLDQLTVVLGRIPTPQDVLIYGMLTRDNLLDLVQNFTLFDVSDGRPRKLLAHYFQFAAVNCILERMRTQPREARGGIVSHPPGSGTTLTKLFLVNKLRRVIGPNLTLLVSDIKQLDDQNAARACALGTSNCVQARNPGHLRELLRGDNQIITTTVQKFYGAMSHDEPALNERENIFVLVNEAYRTESGTYTARMRSALPNACFIAFSATHTPTTRKIFGEYIHAYSLEQAVVDRARVPIYYEAREAAVRVEDAAHDSVVAAVSLRIETICRDVIEHFETFIRPNGCKAWLIAPDRIAAVVYKETLDRLGGPESALVLSVHRRNPEPIARWQSSREQQRQILARFQDPADPLTLLIGCDPVLGGFKAPIAQVLYLDAPLRGYQLLQAIGRLNGVTHAKDYGLIVDYRGVARALQEALRTGYSHMAMQDAFRPKTDLSPLLQPFHDAVAEFFAALPLDDLEACVRVLEAPDTRTAFEHAFQRFARSMDLLVPDRATQPFLANLAWFGEIRHEAGLRFRDLRLDLWRCRPKVRALLEARLAARSPAVNAASSPGELEHEIRRELDLQPAVFDAQSRELAVALGEELRALAVVDWLHKEDVQRRMRQAVKRRLRRSGLSVDEIESLTSKLMEVARDRLA